MSYTLTIEIQEDSPQGQNIDAVSEAEHVSREEAVLRLLAISQPLNKAANIEERRRAIQAVTGSIEGDDWVIHDFNDQKYADIERENERDII